MPRTSTIDTHPDRAKINAALIRGEPFRDIGRRFGVNKDVLQRHLRGRLADRAAEAEKALAIRDAEYVWRELDATGRRIKAIMGACEEQVKALGLAEREGRDTARLLLQAVSEMHSHLELLARIEGKIKERTVILFNSPVVIEMQTLILNATRGHPDIRRKITEAMKAAEAVEVTE